MQFTSILSLGLMALTATAAPTIMERDLATFQTAFNAAGAALIDFDNAILALTPETDVPTAIADLTARSDNIQNILRTQSALVNATTPLGLFEALGLLPLVNDLTATATKTVDDLIAKKPIIDAAGQSPFVVSELQDVKAETQAFIAGAITKVPAATQGLANNAAQAVVAQLDRGIAAFSTPARMMMAKL